MPPACSERPFSSYDATLYVPKGCKDKYQQAAEWTKFADIVEMEYSGIDEISTDGERVDNGVISMLDNDDEPIMVYDLSGNVVYKGVASEINGLNAGLYIVRSGNKVSKIIL